MKKDQKRDVLRRFVEWVCQNMSIKTASQQWRQLDGQNKEAVNAYILT